MINLTKHQFKVCESVALGLTHYYLNDQHDKRYITESERAEALSIIPKLPKGWMQQKHSFDACAK